MLLATTVRMIEAGSLWALARSTRSDALVLALTFTVTVALDLVTAVAVGIAVAVVVALRAVARTATLRKVPLEAGDHSAEEHALLSEHIVAYRLDGPLFFAAAHTFLLELVDGLHDAFAVRAITQQAIGIIIATQRSTPDHAYATLRLRVADTETSLFDTAHAVITAQ